MENIQTALGGKFSKHSEGGAYAFIDVLGVELFEKMRRTIGGREIKFPTPETLCKGHLLVDRLGLEDATTICEMFQGEFLSIPCAPREKIGDIRAAQIKAAVASGKTRSEIAEELGVSVRWVREICSKYKIGAAQPKIRVASNSNAPLTQGADISGTRQRTAPENRVSGL